jgi:hypothetical protein
LTKQIKSWKRRKKTVKDREGCREISSGRGRNETEQTQTAGMLNGNFIRSHSMKAKQCGRSVKLAILLYVVPEYKIHAT